jgi:hypothetical protein
MLAVARLEVRRPADVYQLELELDRRPRLAHDLQRPLAEGAVGRVVNRDSVRYGYRPRVVVASATRSTARPYEAMRRLVE